MDIKDYLTGNVDDKFEFYNYNHAVEVITQAFPNEWSDLMTLLNAFELTVDDVASAGGAETNIPGKFDDILYPRGWKNRQIEADLHIKFYDRIADQKQYEEFPSDESIINAYIGKQHVDYIKGRVAIDVEWNKKDLSFDRTLTALRTYYDCRLISAGIVVTRSGDLNEAFKTIPGEDGKPIIKKYGSSTTWMGKLTPRIQARQAGGCPVLAIGIKKSCIIDL